MIVCKSCGFHNQDKDSFCGSCGAFLEWTGEKVAPKPIERPPEAEVEEAKPKRGLLSRVSSILYADVGDREKIVRPPVPRVLPARPPALRVLPARLLVRRACRRRGRPVLPLVRRRPRARRRPR